jgi:competence protein ComEC
MTGIVAGTAALTGAAFGWWGATIVALLSVLALAIRSSRSRWAICAVATVAAVLGAGRAETSPLPADLSHLAQDVRSVTIVTAPVFTGQRQYFAVEPAIDDGPTNYDLSGRVCVIADPIPVVHLGDSVQLQGKMEVAADLSQGSRSAILTRVCAASLFATSLRVIASSPSAQRALADLRTRLGVVLRRSAPGDAGVLLAGLVTGDDDGFSTGRKDAFIRTGTTHLTAVSGSNLALVAAILATIGSATIGRNRVPWQLVTILGVWAYAFVSGVQAPSLRAAIVATAAVLAFSVGRRPDFVTLILLAAGAMVLVEPRQIESLGFRLSVAASLALVLVLTGLMPRDRTSHLGGILTATVAAQLATLPVLLTTFGTVSLTSVPANIVAVPLVAIAMPLASVAAMAGLIWLPLGEVIAAPAALVATALIRAIDILGAREAYVSVGVPPLPAAAVITATVAILLLLIGGNEFRGLVGSSIKGAAGHGVSTTAQTAQSQRLKHPGQLDAPKVLLPIAGGVESLPSSAPRIIAWKDPFDALGADPDEAEEKPASEEVGHEVADEGNSSDTISREVVRHDPEAHAGRPPENDHEEQDEEHQHLTALAHHRDVIGDENIES